MTDDSSRYRAAPPRDDRLAGVQPVAVHLDGVWWFDAPLPPVEHDCWRQTVGTVGYLSDVARCACGAVSLDGGPWIERNSERTERPETNGDK